MATTQLKKNKMSKLSRFSLVTFKERLINFFSEMIRLFRFFVLLQVYLIETAVNWMAGFKLIPSSIRKILSKFAKRLLHLMKILDQAKKNSISQREIIRMSIQNMVHKRNRTVITIGGMSIGIGAIVFLVSMGFGLQELVVSRIAKLEEMRQADIMPDAQGQVFIDDGSLSEFQKIGGVEEVYPLISLVGRVNIKNSVTDAVVHGVTGDYLKNSAMKPIEGIFFDSNQIANELSPGEGEVAGITTSIYEEAAYQKGVVIQEIFFTIDPDAWLRVRSGPGTDYPIIGYTRRIEGSQEGEEVWGAYYLSDDGAGEAAVDSSGNTLGRWIKSNFPIWQLTKCSDENNVIEEEGLLAECESGYQKINSSDGQKWVDGYIAEIAVSLQELPDLSYPRVLGEATELGDDINVATVSAIDQEISEFIQATSSSEMQTATRITLDEKAQKQAVINEAMAQVLGMTEESPIGKEFQISFILVEETMSDQQNQKIETEPETYEIVGVLSGGQNPIIYVPFIDLRSLGIDRFSQARIDVENTDVLGDARVKVEAMGYGTSSVADTVKQVEDLFASLRLVLGTLGMVALAVAALGMFNTLTISLLERTREVGVLKSMGMKSKEVKNLFLTESMIMGFFGGIIGIIFGMLLGRFVSLFLSVFSLLQGLGFINVVHLPLSFGITVVFLSLIVGFITGYYPAKRATKISALNALRYE
jgi:ABC-type antimicrobial peptide transport system permease subunit